MVLVLFAILAFRSSVCCRKESVLSNLTPRNVGVASCCSCTASSLSWLSRFASLGSRVKIVPTVFRHDLHPGLLETPLPAAVGLQRSVTGRPGFARESAAAPASAPAPVLETNYVRAGAVLRSES